VTDEAEHKADSEAVEVGGRRCRDAEGVIGSEDRYERGLETRRAVLGREHVDRSLEQASPFMRPMQELVTEYCWGAVWNREGLDRRTRSLLNVAMLTALDRPQELGAHVRGALTNGCSKEEIQETLLQAAVYCGMPAGLDAFRVAERALDEAQG
jgi:4-carboxymuconolactone decarboxylase